MRYRALFFILWYAVLTLLSVMSGFITGVMLATNKPNIFIDKYFSSGQSDDEFMQMNKSIKEKKK